MMILAPFSSCCSCSFRSKKGSNVLFPGALPLASAGVGGYCNTIGFDPSPGDPNSKGFSLLLASWGVRFSMGCVPIGEANQKVVDRVLSNALRVLPGCDASEAWQGEG